MIFLIFSLIFSNSLSLSDTLWKNFLVSSPSLFIYFSNCMHFGIHLCYCFLFQSFNLYIHSMNRLSLISIFHPTRSQDIEGEVRVRKCPEAEGLWYLCYRVFLPIKLEYCSDITLSLGLLFLSRPSW